MCLLVYYCVYRYKKEINMKKFAYLLVFLAIAQWWFKYPVIEASSNDVSFNYVVKYTDGAEKRDRLPMLIALHGNGDTLDGFYENALDQYKIPARIILLEGPISFGGGNAWPWTPVKIQEIGLAMSEVVEQLTVKYSTVQKPVLLGFSGGGMMAYYQSLKHGSHYSYIFPISGQIDENLVAGELFDINTSVFAYHGKNDRVVSFTSGKNAARMLQEKGSNVSFTEFSGGHQSIFTEMKSEITSDVEGKMKGLVL